MINAELQKILAHVMPSAADFEKIITMMSGDEFVKRHVILNHDNNRWWPTEVLDWRKRMLIAGLSTRVSYRMIESYAAAVKALDQYSFEELDVMDDLKFGALVKSIGLIDTRIKFKKSIFSFINGLEQSGVSIDEIPNETLLRMIVEKVSGASYKVAQCCILYAKGYYQSGVMPVDSGMKDNLGYCLGFSYPPNSKGHEILRKQFELLTGAADLNTIAVNNGYADRCNLPESNLTWWAHLVLIYYKRFYCNQCNPNLCILRRDPELRIGAMCDKTLKFRPVRKIVIEGIDGAGKSTLAEFFRSLGYRHQHNAYKRDVADLYDLYRAAYASADREDIVFDRCFISEIVYGSVLRNASRISAEQFEDLLQLMEQQSMVVYFLHAGKESILSRAIQPEDRQIVTEHYHEIQTKYREVLDKMKSRIPVIEIDTDKIDFLTELHCFNN